MLVPKKKNNTRAKNQDIKALKQDVIEHIKGLAFLFLTMFITCLSWSLLNIHCILGVNETSIITKCFMVVFTIQFLVFVYKLFVSVVVTIKEYHRIRKEY